MTGARGGGLGDGERGRELDGERGRDLEEPRGDDDLEETENPRNFLGLPDRLARRDSAAGIVLPVPYERTVSYGGGAGRGPAGILEASRYVELYDHELDDEPCRRGIHTLPPLEVRGEALHAVVDEVAGVWADLLAGSAFPVMLGGEHTVTVGAVRSAAERHPRLSVLQLDAHADLRDSYEGSPWSHACVMRRVAEWAPVVGVGIRALSSEEMAFARRRGLPLVFAERLQDPEAVWIDEVLAALSDTVYLSFDVDYFDPALVPTTGTPEPGGGMWYPTLAFLRRVFAEKQVIGADVVELAPRDDQPAGAFLTARLVYKLFAYRFEHATPPI